MITAPIDSMIPDIRALWKQCFGDDDAFLDLFFAHRYHPDDMLVCVEDDEELVAMLCLFPLTLRTCAGALRARYIYAVATEPSWRGLGVSHTLMQTALTRMQEDGEDVAILVPASDSLFGFYQKQGFQPIFSLQCWEVNACDLPRSDGTAQPCGVEAYLRLRNAAFADTSAFAAWDARALSYIHLSVLQEHGHVLHLQQGAQQGCAVVVMREGVAHVKELALCGLSPADAVALVHSVVQAQHYRVSLPAGTLPALADVPFAMAQPVSARAETALLSLQGAAPYFALAMD